MPGRPEEGVLAVDGVTLSAEEGEILGLLGPNGAGKSTLVRMLCTLILPTAGTALVGGHDLADESAVKRQVGLAAGEERSFYWRMSGQENLRFYGALQGLAPAWTRQRIAELGRELDLEEALAGRFDRLSTGMRRRLDLARALLHNPPILLLDEPTRSLDPGAAARLHEEIRRVAAAGHTVLLVTHDLAEAEALCSRVAILHAGRLRAVGPVAELRRAVAPGRRYRLIARLPEGAAPPWTSWPWLEQELPSADDRRAVQLYLPADLPLEALLHPLRQAGAEVFDLAREEASLEEVFQRWTGEEGPPNLGNQVPPCVRQGGEDSLAEPASPYPSVDGGEKTTLQTQVPARARQEGEGARPPSHLPPLLATLARAVAFVWRDVRVQFSYRLATLLQLFGILFSVAAFYFVARVFGAAASPYLGEYGGNYFAFVLVGIAFASYQGVGMGVFTGAIRSGQVEGTLEAMLVTPTRLEMILLASALWSYLQASWQVILYLLAGALLFGVSLGHANLGTALLALLLSILAFSGLGILSASFVLVSKRGDPVTFLFAGLSTLLSGVYYPVAVLPTWLQPLSTLLPMTHALRAMRLALLEGAGIAQVAPELLTLALFAAVVVPGGILAFRWALKRAKKEGSLTQY